MEGEANVVIPILAVCIGTGIIFVFIIQLNKRVNLS